MTMGERIKQLRKENGMTQTALAETLGVTKGTVSTWETNSRTPGLETLDAMCSLFNRRMDYILGRTDDASPFEMSEEQKHIRCPRTERQWKASRRNRRSILQYEC